MSVSDARLKAETDLLKAALRWALENGAMLSSGGILSDHGCGCCANDLEAPPQFAQLIAEAVNVA